jgi:hypothetical protein
MNPGGYRRVRPADPSLPCGTDAQVFGDKPDAFSLLQQIVAEQGRQAGILADILRALQRTHGPRDDADAAVLLAIAETIGDRRFTASQLLAHAEVSPALHEALQAADIVDTRDLGWFCRRVHGSPRPSVQLERAGECRIGILWRVRFNEAHHRADG